MAVGYTNFPASLDSYETLLRLGLGTETFLLQPITEGMDTLVVADPSRLSSPSGLLLVGNEWITYGSVTGNLLSQVSRGQFQNDGGYPSSAHPDGERVLQFMTPIHHRVLADAIIAIQTALGTGTLAETVQDIVGALVADSATIDATYNDAGNAESFGVINDSNTQRTEHRKNTTGATVSTRRRINWIEGTGIGITVADNSGNNETNVTIAITSEGVQDIVGAMIADSASIDANYDDAGNLETLAVIYSGTGAANTAARSDHNHNADPALVHPTGSIIMYGAAAAPTGWLLCHGSAVSRTTYAALFGLIGTAYGAGDGSTTFNLPDLRDRFPIGIGAHADNNVLGETGGVREVTLSAAQSGVPTHTHGVSAITMSNPGNHSHSTWSFNSNNNTETGGSANRLQSEIAGGSLTGAAGGHVHTLSGNVDNNSATGAASAHTNMPPFQTVQFIIKT